jgi:hypothetical protein
LNTANIAEPSGEISTAIPQKYVSSSSRDTRWAPRMPTIDITTGGEGQMKLGMGLVVIGRGSSYQCRAQLGIYQQPPISPCVSIEIFRYQQLIW